MKYYTSPLKDNKPYWVPIVVKNRDYLIGYLKGVELIGGFVSDIGILDDDLYLDSSRFNDVMKDGRREHQLTHKEKIELFLSFVNEKIQLINNEHIENKTEYESVLDIECLCGFGFYSWAEYAEIPETQFCCQNCGRVLIDYIGINDFEIKYDGGEDGNQ